ncbi:hypothetical protein WDJ50_02730 [Deinococcus sp. VB142]|uniref:Uncharacterized protein n=1 Tax=Deinococcus sp. VB142 TaxID=3112952 RepID=A0AAU6Q4C5_9DEIO
MSGVDTKALWDLLESLGLDIIDINVDRQQQGLEVVVDEGELLAHGVQILIRQLTRESQKFDALSTAYATLRREHITALVRLHRAHGVVAAAALRHKDERLAALARDELRGLNKPDAEQKIPRASEVLKGAGL